jgi:hypothetical protein
MVLIKLVKIHNVNKRFLDLLMEEAKLDELDIIGKAEDEIPQAKQDYSFQHSHPQYQTHWMWMKEENPFVVLNFLLNTLPRCDCGN